MEPNPKKQKRVVNYRPEMTTKYPCLIKSSKGPGYIYCTVCYRDFMVDSGLNDCKRHVEGPNHIKNAKSVKSIPTLNFASTSNYNKQVDDVTSAEVLFTGFLVEHNIAMAAADHVGKLFKSMFLNKTTPAREIIEKYSCGRTKTTCIVKELAKDETTSLVKAMQTGTYSIATDASNDRHDKLYPIVIRLAVDGQVQICLLSIIEVEGKNTGVKVAEAILSELESKDISFKNCIAFTSDNANVMVGKKSGCYGELLKKNENLISTGCICHRLHLAAEWAGKQLPINVEQFFIDIYYYIEKSSGRVKTFKHHQEECGVKLTELCKHAPTRWLSLSKTCRWVLEQWPALDSYFSEECAFSTEQANDLDAEEQKQDRKKRVLDNLKSRTVKAYVTYLAFILPEFDKVNVLLQSESSMIHLQLRLIQKFIKTLMDMLLKPSAMVYKGITDVDFKSKYNIKTNKDLVIGEDTKRCLEKMNKEKVDEFYPSITKFLQTAINYLIKHGQLEDKYLMHAEVADISLRASTSWSHIEFFIDNFPTMLPSGVTKDQLQMQFVEYQTCEVPSNLPIPIDEQWKMMGESVKDCTGNPSLKELSRVMSSIVAVPHSNAACERIFSTVRKNRTDFRASMSVNTLENLMIL